MRVVPFILSSLLTIGLIILLDNNWLIGGQKIPAFGRFLNPQEGCWQNAEPADANYSEDLSFPQLNGKVNVYLDDRLVPHVFAEKESDAYFVQGYLHAKFRIWQMELQTHFAAGRAAEIVGSVALEHDREFRRLGMVYAAENSLALMEKDPNTKLFCDAYTNGINAYIESLDATTLPLEYKLMGYKPEKWNNLKTALFMKYISFDLAGHDNDFEMTNARQFFGPADFEKLFPLTQDSLDPIIPKGTAHLNQKVFPVKPAGADSIYLKPQGLVNAKERKPLRENGSNNWVVSGKKTQTGSPILCSDPHLSLNLPSIWFEMQISTPDMNLYGVSFPGAPGVMIGFNDSCAFGFTNGGRDVRDYYEITFKDQSRLQYSFNGKWHSTKWRIETFKVSGKNNLTDSVAYVQLGNDWLPVMYDNRFGGGRSGNKKHYAVMWNAHKPSNELKMINLLNHSKNYNDYSNAITLLATPGQNCAFACKNGDISIRTQGNWPAKWKEQGDYIMPGIDSSYLWQGMIPQDEVPNQLNPERGFVSSANQKPVDDTNYPYYLGRNYPVFRGKVLNTQLSKMQNVSIEDMKALQNSNLNGFAVSAVPVILKHLNPASINGDEKKYFELLKNWNLRNDKDSKGATVYELLWNELFDLIYEDEYKNAPEVILYPYASTLLEALLKDPDYKFVDIVGTTQKENISDILNIAFKNITPELKKLEKNDNLGWGEYKATKVSHLTKLGPFSRNDIVSGGNANAVNATKKGHGPSWRMIVSLTANTEAYGVYPGGQNGNPGSKYYDNFIDTWADGKYYPLWVMNASEQNDSRVKWKMNFIKS